MGGPSVSAPPPPPAAPPPPPQLPDAGVQQAGKDARTRAIGAIGAAQTILTGPQGLTTPASTTKSLLGT